MTNGYYNIQPINVSVGAMTASAVVVTFGASYIPFETSMPYTYTLYSVDGAPLYNGQDVVNEAQLAQWGNNDDYIINVMASIAGLTIIW